METIGIVSHENPSWSMVQKNRSWTPKLAYGLLESSVGTEGAGDLASRL